LSMPTFIAKGVFGEIVKVTETSGKDSTTGFDRYATGISSKSTGNIVWRYNTRLLVHGTFAFAKIAITIIRATISLSIVAEIEAFLLKANTACFLQIAAPAWTILLLSFFYFASFLSLKDTETTTFWWIALIAWGHA
jgi:hypothetical protein